MPDPAIRLRIIVAPDGSASLAGVEKVVAPIRKAVKDASASVSKDFEGMGAAVSKMLQRLRGFNIDKRQFTSLTDVLKGLESIDAKLGKLTAGKGFGGITKSVGELNSSLVQISQRLDDIAAKMGKVSGLTPGLGSAGRKPLKVAQAIEDQIKDVLAGATPTGEMSATLNRKRQITGLIAQLAQGDARVAYNYRTGSYKVSLPNDVERDEAIKALRASLAGAKSLGVETLMRTGKGAITRELFDVGNGLRGYLYPDAKNPYIRYAQAAAGRNAPSVDVKDVQAFLGGDGKSDAAFAKVGQTVRKINGYGRRIVELWEDNLGRVAEVLKSTGEIVSIRDPKKRLRERMATFASDQKQQETWLQGQGYTQNREYWPAWNKKVIEWIKDGQIAEQTLNMASKRAAVRLPIPEDPRKVAEEAKKLADRNQSISDRLSKEGFNPTGKTFEQLTEVGVVLVREFKNAAGAVAQFDASVGKLTVKTPEDNTKAIADAQAKALAFLQAKGFTQVGQRVEMTPEGQRTSIQYRNAKGGTALYTPELGQLNANIPATRTLLQKLGDTVSWVGQRFAKDLGQTALSWLSKLAHPFQTTISFLLKMGGAIYTVKNLFRGFDSLFIDPLRKGIAYILDSTEQYRQFELSIAGVVGGLGKARQVSDALVQSSRHLPLTVKELQEIGRGMAYMGPLTSRIALGDAGAVSMQVGEFSKLVAKLAIYDPIQGAEGVMLAMREAMSGELRSLRTRLEIPIAQVAASINKTQQDLSSNPRLLIQALSTWANQYIPDAAMQQRDRLYSVRWEKLQSSFQYAARMVGESGIFDKILDALENVTESIFSYLEKPEWKQRAASISRHLEGILKNVTEALVSGLRELAGSENGADAIQTVAESIDFVLGKFEQWTKNLDQWTITAVNFFKQIGKGIAEMIGEVAEAASNVKHWKDVLPDSGTTDLRQFIAHREAVNDLLKQMGMPNLRQEAGRQSASGAYWSPGDRYLKEYSSLFDNLYFLEDLYAKVGDQQDLRLPYYRYGGQDAEEQRRIEEVITRIENLTKNATLARSADGGYIGRFVNLPGIQKLIAEKGESYWMDWLKSAHDRMYPPPKPAQPPATQPAGPVYNPRIPWYNQLPPEQAQQFNKQAFNEDFRLLAEFSQNQFGVLFKSMEAAIGRLGQSYHEDQDPVRRLLNEARGAVEAMNEKFQGVTRKSPVTGRLEYVDLPGDVFEKALALSAAKAQQVSQQIEAAQWAATNMPEPLARRAREFISQFQPIRETLENKDIQLQRIAEAMKDNALRFAMALAENLDKASPEVAGAMVQAIQDGTLGVQEAIKQKIRQRLEGQGVQLPEDFFDFSTAQMPAHERARFMSIYFKQMERKLELSSAGGIEGMTAQQVANLGFLPKAPAIESANMLTLYEKQLGLLMRQFDTQQAAYKAAQASGSAGNLDANRAALLETADAIERLTDKMRQLKLNVNYVAKSFIEFGQKVEEALENSVGDALYNLITGTGTLKDALLGFARDVVRAFSQMAAHNLVAALLGPSSTAQGGPGVLTQFFTSIFGGAARGATAAPAANSANVMDSGIGTVGGNGTAFAAAGAVWKGGFTPIYAFSQGGIVNRPVIGIVGEGKEPAEAMVPLPDGRSIPVTLNGRTGGDTEVKVYVVANYQEAIARGFKRNRDFLVDAIAGDVKKGGKVKKALRRVPG